MTIFQGLDSPIHTCTQTAGETALDPTSGVFSRGNANPFRNHTVVFLNYCSGDMFLGNELFGFGEQRGLKNVLAAVQWAQQNMDPNLESLVLIGESAGGVAVQLWARHLLNMFSHSRSLVIVDSLITGIFPARAQAALIRVFHLCRIFLLGPRDKMICMEGTLDLVDVFEDLIDDFPQTSFAVINSKADSIQISVYDLMAAMVKITPSFLNPFSYYHLVNQYLERLGAKANFASYLVNSPLHSWSSQAYLATTDTSGSEGAGLHGDVTLLSWLSDLLLGSGSVQSQCHGTPLVITASPHDSLDYCDLALHAKAQAKEAEGEAALPEANAGHYSEGWVIAFLITLAVCFVACFGVGFLHYTCRRRKDIGYEDCEDGTYSVYSGATRRSYGVE